jgi:hypothetical protein
MTMLHIRYIPFLLLISLLFSSLQAQEEYLFAEPGYETLFEEIYTNSEGKNLAVISTINSADSHIYIVELENEEVFILFTIQGQFETAFIYNDAFHIVGSDSGIHQLHILASDAESYSTINLDLDSALHIYDMKTLVDGYLISGNLQGNVKVVKLDFQGNLLDEWQDDQFTLQYPEFLTFMEERVDGTFLSAIYCDRLAIIDPNSLSDTEWQLQPQICGPVDRMIPTNHTDLGNYAILGSLPWDAGPYNDLFFQSRHFNEESTEWFYLADEGNHYIHGDALVTENLIYFSSLISNTFSIGGEKDFNLTISDHEGVLLDSFSYITPEKNESLAEIHVGENDVWIFSSQEENDEDGQLAFAIRIQKDQLNFTSVNETMRTDSFQLTTSHTELKIISSMQGSFTCELYSLDGRLIRSKIANDEIIMSGLSNSEEFVLLKVYNARTVRIWKLFLN